MVPVPGSTHSARRKSTIDDGNRPSMADPSATADSGRSVYRSAAGPFFSSLWLLSQLMEYSYLLDMADDSEDPYMRLVYACKYIFLLLFSICSECSVKMISETDYMMQLLGRYLFTMLISEHGSLLIPSSVKHMKWSIMAELHLLRSRSINFSLPPVLWWYLCSCV
ncbi:hypothetical protein BHE74_00006090 [Ensete ventricosum]|nr:hypothetical protein BHE74_00006090 [Ensete ventricosum]